MDSELRAYLDENRRHVDAVAERFEAHLQAGLEETTQRLEARLQTGLEETAQRLEAHLQTGLEENRRHFGALTEDLRSRIQLVAEGVLGLGERMDRLERSLREEILSAQRELSAMIRFSYAELDRKIQRLEGRCDDLETRLGRLERGRTDAG